MKPDAQQFFRAALFQRPPGKDCLRISRLPDLLPPFLLLLLPALSSQLSGLMRMRLPPCEKR